MSDRRRVLDLFDEQKEIYEKRVDEGIKKYRKGDGKITVCDECGKPLSNVKISVKQKSHEFRFGANIFMLDELETEEKNQKYKEHFAELFNMATLPFYWRDLEPERGKPRYAKDSPKIYRRPAPDLCIEFCEEHGIEPREHALAYERFFPTWLEEASVEETKREYERRCAEISERYADKIRTIEVTNEMDWKTRYIKFYDEPDFIEWCFKTAEKYFPNNQLCINEQQALVWKSRGRTSDQYFSYIEANMLKGARIDAIGMQFHLFNKREVEYENTREMLNPEKLYRHMDLYARFGKPLQITEVTIPAYSWDEEDEALQAELLEKLYSVWFSHPNVEQIIYWNLVDGYAHGATPGDMATGENYYHGGLMRFDMTPKPAFLKLKELTQKVWHTEEELVTNERGEAEWRGFYGDYDLEIDGGAINTVSLSKKGDNNFNITI
ncbi:MAG: endo-1,4-beta-xylanase [Clostridia bacterium]|nr:endo-1,4-beta-xylanase [Clostridia bacterium]